MRRWWPVFVLFLFALGGVGFWSLGALPPEPDRIVTLREIEGAVSLHAADGTTRSAVAGDRLDEGSRVVTTSDGRATIDWLGRGETRVGPLTELSVVRASVSDGGMRVRMRLESGRIWTRILRLLDLEDDVSVETSDVVATVRGTSFDVEKRAGEPTTVWVADSVIETVADGRDAFLVEGFMAEFGLGRSPDARPLSEADLATSWFMRNREADAAFRADALSRLKTSLAAERMPTGGWWRGLIRLSEGMRVWLASGSRRDRLADRYLLRRLIGIRQIAEEGKSGLAYRDVARLDEEFRRRVASGDEAKRSAREAASSAQVVFRDVAPSSPAYRIKQQVEEWMSAVATSDAERVFARLTGIDARLDEAADAIMSSRADVAVQVLYLARQGLANVDRERAEAGGLAPSERERIDKTWRALTARAEALEARMAVLTGPELEALPVMDAEEASVDEEIEDVPVVESEPQTDAATIPAPTSTASEPVPPEPASQPKPVSLSISPAQMTIGFYERVTYQVIVVYENGSTKDVTKSARFAATPPGYGALFDNVFSATELQGAITITATYEESGTTLGVSGTLNVVDRNR